MEEHIIQKIKLVPNIEELIESGKDSPIIRSILKSSNVSDFKVTNEEIET
jgi:hypothetical protein